MTAIGYCLHPSASGHGTHEELGLPACPSVLFFDRPCPGCGLTTSWTATIHGDLASAFRAHPFGPIMYFAFTAMALLCLVGGLRSRILSTNLNTVNKILGTFLAVFFAFGVWRFATTSHYQTVADQQSVIGR